MVPADGEVGPPASLVDTPLGPIAQISFPQQDGCTALEAFPFADVSGLDTSGWGDSTLWVTVHGIETASRSIDIEITPGLGLYVIRDGELVGYLPSGRYGDPEDPVSRRLLDTWSALYLDRSDRPREGYLVPTLVVEGADASGRPFSGGLHLDRAPVVDNCQYVLEELPPGGM